MDLLMVLKLAIAAKIGYNLIVFKRNKHVLVASDFFIFLHENPVCYSSCQIQLGRY
jgi:hypothetical protein